MLPGRPHSSRYFRAGPISDGLTRSELVQRLRLLWQGAQGLTDQTAVAQALEIVIDAFGLKAERAEIFDNEPGHPSV